MTIGWIDGGAGASGDMLLGALVDAGVDLSVIQRAVDDLHLGIEFRAEPVVRAGIGGIKIDVHVPETRTVRHLPEIVELFDTLEQRVRSRALSTFRRLAEAEATVHRTDVDDVHFHEVGALDSIADVVGVCAGLVDLGLEELHCSTLSLGSGMTRGAHGPIPVPAPAVLELMRGVGPVASGPAPFESTTPTGAALLAEWVTSWGSMPDLTVDTIGSGAGTRDSDVVANLCRLVVGERSESTAVSVPAGDVVVQLDANVDDLDPRMWPEAITTVMSAGAVDAWVTPIVMKKGRPAHIFSAMCAPADVEAVSAAIFRETTTIGLRRHVLDRDVLDRTASVVMVAGHAIRVKTAERSGEIVNRSVEWDDVVRASRALGRPLKEIVSEAYGQLSGPAPEDSRQSRT
ncbi:nickel pincer cofactor biosynthesis protein LarC [Ilumatobacter nonamiensis]|uniref:nickel pincer cofactor biosynthesis protein LarC n=1 Tax=Ilumatobacter nonamiensis TaxID=467093 RepID=UPI000347BE53|nr:nickel pincer cofactor biosynthesis protein LarC [Ilumatobacter nonamiensis]